MIVLVTLPAMAQDDGLSSALDSDDYVLVVTVERVIEAHGQTRLNGHIVDGAHLALSVDSTLRQIPGSPCPRSIDAWWSVLDKAAYDRRTGGRGRCTPMLTEWFFKAPKAGDRMIVSAEFDQKANCFEVTLFCRRTDSPANRSAVLEYIARQKVMNEAIPQGPQIDDSQRALLTGLAESARYERRYPAGRPWPENITRAEIVNDPSLLQSVRTGDENPLLKLAGKTRKPTLAEPDVRHALSSYRVVSGENWAHSYHHVAGLDETGWIVLPDASKLKWAIQPGGLAIVIYPDGGIVFMARDTHPSRKEMLR